MYRNWRSLVQNSRYSPIACALHDSLELAALRGLPVHLVFQGADGELHCGSFTIRDIRSRDGAEWLLTEPPGEIRLDRIVTMDGEKFSREC